MHFPTLPQVSFVATMLGCWARSERLSELRSMPLVTPGNYTMSECSDIYVIYLGRTL